MQEFTIKSWECSCGYCQDFEPTPEEMAKHSLGNDDTCPSCKEGQLKLSVASRMKMKCCEQADIDTKRAELEAEAPLKIKHGMEQRPETAEEKNKRADEQVEKLGLSKAVDRKSVKDQIMALPDLVVKVPAYREETEQEKAFRIEKHIKNMKVLTPEQIQDLRDKYE